DGERMRRYVRSGKTICGDYIGQVIAQALEMGESNACMKCIVAAPTAGSCGVMPAVLLPYQKKHQLDDDSMVRALYVAGAIGQVVAAKASIAGAAGGCQYEIGTASAMAAGAVCYLAGGSAQAVCHAAAMAIKSLLGLVCDPIAGLVEVPCVKRNAAGAMVAMCSADMALAGIRSAVPPDEVILAMRDVGDKMDVSLRETGLGGVAGTPFGIHIAEKMSVDN
ncbi:MAG: L-serine ammonia-lyase, iron-sulfur-dependent, subunit alpha, partial [bacterium]|nr:L-serine ammonia-lyase, iron-sulfur-dependent, subunit alpha [bacterium]